MLAEIPVEQAAAIVEQVAADLLLEADVAAPPVEAFAVARRLGLIVARGGNSANRARLVRLGAADRGAILLADEPRPERRQWAVAHEIGETAAHRVFAELGVDPNDAPAAARETIANRIAGCLLLPRDWFHASGRALDWDLLALKTRFATASHELIARRMLAMPPSVIVSLLDHGRLRWRRSNLTAPPPMMPEETAAWQTAHESGKPARCNPATLPVEVADVRSWPIHEPAWRREIVRTELYE